MWNKSARECGDMRKNPEKYIRMINKYLEKYYGTTSTKPGELERLKKMIEEYEQRIEIEDEE